jgi:hypothetical protein
MSSITANSKSAGNRSTLDINHTSGVTALKTADGCARAALD